MIISLTTLEAILRVEDIEGLLAAGAPNDEYQDEALAMQIALQQLRDDEVTADRVAALIWRIWDQNFGPFAEEDRERRRTALSDLVRRILHEHYIYLGIIGVKPDSASISGRSTMS